MRHRILFIDGDGVGPELAAATRMCVEATGVDIEWDIRQAGVDVYEKVGTPLPEEVVEAVREAGVAIKAPVTTPVGTGFRSVNVHLRQVLDLYACVRPCKQFRGVRSFFSEVPVDIVVVRENTEDLYTGIEFEKGRPETANLIRFIAELEGSHIRADSGISIKPISVTGSRRIVRYAFEYALANGRRKVTSVHKANIMKYSDGLFLEVSREVAKEYEGRVEFEDRIVDNMCMQLVQKPELYDVLVLPNLYGDILSDLCTGLVGGLGVGPGGNFGDNCAVFEAVHGSAPKYKGMNKVNPTALILSAVMMLHHIGENGAADRLEAAVAKVIAEGKDVTYDLKPTRDDPTAVGTREMAEAICRAMES